MKRQNVIATYRICVKGKVSQFLRNHRQKERNKDTPYKELESCITLLYASLSFCGDSFLERALLFRGPYALNPLPLLFSSKILFLWLDPRRLQMCHLVNSILLLLRQLICFEVGLSSG